MSIEFDSCAFENCTCATCGITYFVPLKFRNTRREDHRTFYCPNGHAQYIPAESDSEKFKRLYEKEQQCCTRANQRLLAEEAESRRGEFRLMQAKSVSSRLRKKLQPSESEEALG